MVGARVGGRWPRLLSRNLVVITPISKRSLITTTCHRQHFLRGGSPTASQFPKRRFTGSAAQGITGQEAPSANAYISSGILAGQKDLVDVKKVLVIGSGGLSIGQAGEFDYSGKV